jgi:hypothetical protein
MKPVFASGLLLVAASAVWAQPVSRVGTLTSDVAAPGQAPRVTCESLASLHAVVMSGGPPQLPVHCAATVSLKPRRGAHLKMELWMPTGAWNGKLLTLGKDGHDLIPPDMAEPLRHGYAVLETAGTHSDAAAIHETVLKAKALIVAFYGAAPRFSYFTGSAAVQVDPADFDGIVMGTVDAAATDIAAVTDLAVFKMRGGKIIEYRVGSDAALPAEQAIGNYERVAQAQGGLAQTGLFYRIFLVPTPDHGKGTYSVNWIEALEEWVERARAPESVLAKHVPPPDAVVQPPPAGAVVFEPAYGVGVICAYPDIARLQAGLGEVPVDWICLRGP